MISYEIKSTVYEYMRQQPENTPFSPAILHNAAIGFSASEIKQALISLWLDGCLSYKRPYFKVNKHE